MLFASFLFCMKNNFILLFLALFSSFLFSKTAKGLDFLSDNSPEENIAFSEEWQALLHYRPSWTGGVKSTIDSSTFFLAKDGKTNPETELKATIELFNNSDRQKEKCLFPARWKYLYKKGLLQKPLGSCPEYEQFKKDLNPVGVTLIFTDAYMNNPASLFGHTLLRIDIPEGRTQLVAHGANYGAFVDEEQENGVLFAVLGLTGGYFGGWTVKPYYRVIQTYNNIENRDIWEYTLNLTDDEIDFFVDHLWEVGNTQTRYFFFTENCSYMIMELLDAVRPSLKLADDFPIQTIPLDTLKAVSKRSDFVKKTAYRPSRQKRIMNAYRQMNALQKKALTGLVFEKKEAQKKLSALTLPQQADVTQTAYEYTQYLYESGKIGLQEYRTKSFPFLQMRQKINQKETVRPPQTPQNPALSHDSSRFSFSLGAENGKIFEEISIRPAYNSLTDRPDGLLKGAQINFLNTQIRYDNQTEKLTLQRFSLLEIASVSQVNALFQPVSYQIEAFAEREKNLKTKKDGIAYQFKTGGGASFELQDDVFGFFFLNGLYKTGKIIPHHQAVGLSAATGLLAYFRQSRLSFRAEKTFSDNESLQAFETKTIFAYSLSRNLDFKISHRFLKQRGKTQNTFETGFFFFF